MLLPMLFLLASQPAPPVAVCQALPTEAPAELDLADATGNVMLHCTCEAPGAGADPGFELRGAGPPGCTCVALASPTRAPQALVFIALVTFARRRRAATYGSHARETPSG
jgi:hypothetical protein